MKLIIYELYKVFSRKNVLCILCLLVLANLWVFYQEQAKNNNYLLKNVKYYNEAVNTYKNISNKEVYKDIEKKSQMLNDFSVILDYNMYRNEINKSFVDEIKKNKPHRIDEFIKSNYINDKERLLRNSFIYNLLLKQMDYITKYDLYIDNMKKRANEMLSISIFNDESSFSYKNILKSTEDFEKLKHTSLELGIEDGVSAFASFRVVDLIAVVAILLICIFLFMHEKEANLLKLIRSNRRGRLDIIVAKIISLTVISIVLSVILYGSIIFLAQGMYGFGDLSRNIQSLQEFKSCNLQISVGEFIACFFLGKVLVNILAAMIISCIFIIFERWGNISLSLSLIFGLSCLANIVIHPLSFINILKYINIFSWYDTFNLLAKYKNINFFSYPINNVFVSSIAASILLIALCILMVRMYIKNHCFEIRLIPNPFAKFKLKRGSLRIARISGNLLYNELYKLMFTAKCIIVLILALIIGFYQLNLQEIKYDKDDAVYNNYMRILEGELTQDKIAFLQEEKKKFNELLNENYTLDEMHNKGEINYGDYLEKRASLEAFAAKKKAFDKTYKQYENLAAVASANGKAYFINELGTDYIFKDFTKYTLNSLLFMGMLIFCASKIFSVDYKNGFISIVRCTKRGRLSLIFTKCAVGCIFAFCFQLIIYLPQYINLTINFDVHSWNVPVQNVAGFGNIESVISILEFILFVNIFQLIASIIITQSVILISLITKRENITLLISLIIFICPVLIQLAGISFINGYTFNRAYALYSYFLANNSVLNIIPYVIVMILLGIFVTYSSWKKYNNKAVLKGELKRWNLV